MANGAYRTSELPIANTMVSTDRVVIIYNSSGNPSVGNGSPGTRTIPLSKLIDAGMTEVLADFAVLNSFAIGNASSNLFVNSSSIYISNFEGTTFTVDTAGVITANGYGLTSIQSNNISNLASVATSGYYNDLSNTPAFAVSAFLDTSNASNINTGSFGAGVTFGQSASPYIFYANTFANVPVVPILGMTMIISDANVTSGDVSIGGGNNAVLVWYNGTNWRCLVD